ncbi:hypothetical protein B6U74_06135 [Candidatus Bathyarchaeota archaeon ex4484_205]|nr:MAG: hypothetical protein B6U74_06135 [Candidatus Bathyarchaeota archaeon ex4484_205]
MPRKLVLPPVLIVLLLSIITGITKINEKSEEELLKEIALELISKRHTQGRVILSNENEISCLQ